MEQDLKTQKKDEIEDEIEEDYSVDDDFEVSGSLEKKKGAALTDKVSATTSTKQYLAQQIAEREK